MIRPAEIRDAEALRNIYNYYVEHSAISFDEAPLSRADMEGRIRNITQCYPWFVREEDGEIVGYAYAGKFRERIAYRFSAEDSIYLKPGCGGRGIGTALLRALITAMEATDIHALIAGITLPNEQSIALHEKFGFKKVAHFPEVGYKLGAWRDVGYWELILKERP